MYASAAHDLQLSSVFDPDVRYLLISYPLDKLWALSLFAATRWKQRVAAITQLEQTRVLLVQGTTDQFTKAEVSAVKSSGQDE